MNIPQVMTEIIKYGVLRANYPAKEKEMDKQEMKIKHEILPKLIEDKNFDFISQRDAKILQIVIEDVPHRYQDRLLAELNSEKEGED